MSTRISSILAACVLTALQAPQAVAQQGPPPSQPEWWWPGPWFMWGAGYGPGWSFWWMCPLMMLVMLVVCGAMFFRHRA